MLDQLKQLTLKTKITFYICQQNSGKMYTIHEGKSFDGDMPEWMAKFIAGGETMLPFEQAGQRKIYMKWVLNAENSVVFLDDAKLGGLTLILNNLLAQQASVIPKAEEASATEIRILTEKLQQVKLSYDKEAKAHQAAAAELEEAKKQALSLKESNLDQAVRLKEALSKNMDLERQVREKESDTVPADMGMNQARSVLTQLKDENSRLTAQIRGWEEKYKKLEDQYNNLRVKLGQEPVATAEPASYDASRGLVPIINALNKVIVTGDASGLNLDALNVIISTPTQSELEKNPEAVKSIIAKLLGMERSGQLTAFQMKKLNNVMR